MHTTAPAPGSVVREGIEYSIPAVTLVRDDGKSVRLSDEINDGRTVVVSFIYTTCAAICPVISQTLAQLQAALGTDVRTVHLMSISIDPERDTPARLREYARRFGAGPSWQHYTGTLTASIAAQRAFSVYRGDKMEHAPVVLVLNKSDGRWVRVEGFATADELLQVIRQGGAMAANSRSVR